MKDKQTKTKLILDNVSYSYGGMPVLQNINLVANSGEFVVLVGPSGCGKTTLLDILSGHIRPQSGSVYRHGVIRTVHQQNGLFPWLTVAQNISMGLRSARNTMKRQPELDELFELVHLKGFENHYPHQLSGGMRQRVELARVLAGQSDILLMDEPFCSLDYLTRVRLRSELVRLLAERPKTVIFVTHDIEEAAQLADRVLVLSNRPTSICCELSINTLKPRDNTHPTVIQTMKTLLDELGPGTSGSSDIHYSNTTSHLFDGHAFLS